MNINETLIGSLEEGHTRFTKLLAELHEEDLKKRLLPSPNSAGFLIRHIGDVEFLFAKNVFKIPDVQVHAKTVIDQKDSGEWTNLSELLLYTQKSFETLKSAILQQKEDEWDNLVITKEFGSKTKAEALGRIITHTAYHAGQLAMILKYGQ
ncbi:DinB family protein [Daejeonella sp.]|jgi:uncharacterized damage-inducible protein DinB|uniref:DinB family protein n=1 Tax=Daejeonella sp. TaxID=2805397 RepID=UPI0037C02634